MYVYKDGMSLEEQKDGAYWERNMLALYLATVMNTWAKGFPSKRLKCGWYVDTDNNWDGWKRVISIADGRFCFHVPDDLDLGSLPQIEKNWDGHTTEQKWSNLMEICGVKPDKEQHIDAFLAELRKELLTGISFDIKEDVSSTPLHYSRKKITIEIGRGE